MTMFSKDVFTLSGPGISSRCDRNTYHPIVPTTGSRRGVTGDQLKDGITLGLRHTFLTR